MLRKPKHGTFSATGKLAAAVYGATEGLSTVLVETLALGGQIGTTSRIENYLGFPVGVSGTDFAQRAFLQVVRFGAAIALSAAVVGMSGGSSGFGRCRARPFAGLGVFYTPLTAHDDVPAGAPVVIAGGGNSAGQAAISLAGLGHHVTMLVRGSDLSAHHVAVPDRAHRRSGRCRRSLRHRGPRR